MEPYPRASLEREPRQNFIGAIGMRLDSEPTEDQILVRPSDPPTWEMVFDNKSRLEGQIRIYETKDRSLPRAVIFRDSNLNAIMPFLLRHFSRAVLVGGARFFFHDLIQAEQPDIVITEMAERCLAVPLPLGKSGSIYWTEDHTRLSFSKFTNVPLPLPGSASSPAGTSLDLKGSGYDRRQHL